MEKSNSIDCLNLKNQVQQDIYENIKKMTPAEEIEYLRRTAESGPLGAWWKRVKAAQGNRRKKAG